MAILCFGFQDQSCLVQNWSPILISQALIWGSWSETQWMIKLSSLKSKVAWVWSASPCEVWLTGSRLLVLMLVTCVINQSGWSDVQWMLKSHVWCAIDVQWMLKLSFRLGCDRSATGTVCYGWQASEARPGRRGMREAADLRPTRTITIKTSDQPLKQIIINLRESSLRCPPHTNRVVYFHSSQPHNCCSKSLF